MSDYKYTAEEIENGLAQCTGGEQFFKHWLGITYTKGVKWLADKAGAYWLIDAIASWQVEARKDRMFREFQSWELRVDLEKRAASLICFRDTDDEGLRQEIEFTDFPLRACTKSIFSTLFEADEASDLSSQYGSWLHCFP